MEIVLADQGTLWPGTLRAAEQYLSHNFVDRVIISTFDQVQSGNEKIDIVTPARPVNPGQGNINYQIVTGLAGIMACRQNIVAKMRPDQCISGDSLIKMHNFYISKAMDEKSGKGAETNVNDLPISKIFVLGIEMQVPFQAQDHVFWGFRRDLLNLYDVPMNMEPVAGEWTKPEWGSHVQRDQGLNFDIHLRMPVYLCASYYARFYPVVKDYLDNWRQYLLDSSAFRREVMEYYWSIREELFRPFPKIDMYWEKYQSGYWYDTYEQQGEYYAKDWES